jgi:hypothetical protein
VEAGSRDIRPLCSAVITFPPHHSSGVSRMESIDVAAVVARLDEVLERTKAADPSARAAGLSVVLEPVRILEQISRSRMMLKNHNRELGYDPSNDAQVVRAAVEIRQHLRARGMYVTVLNFEVPARQFVPGFVENDEEARTDAAILESLKRYS